MPGTDYLLQESDALITVTIDGSPLPGLFDKKDGGDITADGADTYLAGGSITPEAYGGVTKAGELKIARAMRTGRDVPLLRWLTARVNHPGVVGIQYTNPDKSPVTDGLRTYRVKLSGLAEPTIDSNGTALTFMEMTFNVDGLPS
jgi:hypothetical protein